MTTEKLYNEFKANIWNDDHSEDIVLCACAKNENEYITEWIEHYLSMGFDKIIIADNNDDDSLQNIVQSYIDKGILYLLKCHSMNFYQVSFYTLLCRDSNFKWCAFFDIDEFLETTWDIKTLLSKCDKATDVLCFNWIMYDSNGQIIKNDKGVQERFSEPVYPLIQTKENMFVKSIVKGNREKLHNCGFNGSHLPFTEEGLTYNLGGTLKKGAISHANFPLRYKMGYLKHYYTKSFEEWITKSRRGWPDGTVNLNSDYFFVLNTHPSPITDHSKALFCDNKEPKSNLTDEYDVIQVKGDSPFILLRGLTQLMEGCTGHTFMLTGDIDDTFYTICLEDAIKTKNRLVYCSEEELWDVYLKYNDGRHYTYYILTFY